VGNQGLKQILFENRKTILDFFDVSCPARHRRAAFS